MNNTLLNILTPQERSEDAHRILGWVEDEKKPGFFTKDGVTRQGVPDYEGCRCSTHLFTTYAFEHNFAMYLIGEEGRDWRCTFIHNVTFNTHHGEGKTWPEAVLKAFLLAFSKLP